MPVNIDLYKNRLDAYKIGTKDGQIDVLQNQILKDFKSNPSYYEVKINDITRDVIITEVSSLNSKPDEKLLIAKPNESIGIGNIILWDSNNWLCIDTDLDKSVYSKGVIKYCNNTLTWQDSNLDIKSIGCILEDKTSYSSDGTEDNKYLVYSDDKILITIPNNSDTQKIKLNQRFIFNNSQKSIYKVTDFNDLKRDGLLLLTMQKDINLQSTDRLDLNIANYKEPSVTEISGSDTINRLALQSYTTDVSVTWTISNENVEIISQDTNTITLKGLIAGNVVLSADDGTNIYTKNIEVLASLF